MITIVDLSKCHSNSPIAIASHDDNELLISRTEHFNVVCCWLNNTCSNKVLRAVSIKGDKSTGVAGQALATASVSPGHSESDMRMSCNKSTANGAHGGTGSSLAILFYYPTFTFMLNRFPLIYPFISIQRLYNKELDIIIVYRVL